jgi:Aerobic-type carbon monoxide dehydrogenase, middle subunit CoxM/CutM homologs
MRTIIKPYSFEKSDYSNGERVYYLAGGTEALRLNSPVPQDAVLVDLSMVLDRAIRREKGYIVIGNGVTFQALKESEEVPSALRESAAFAASFAIRNSATIAGNIASLRDDSHLIPSLLALSAKLRIVVGDKESEVALDSWIENPRGLILAVLIPGNAKAKAKRIALTSSSHAAVVVAVSPDKVAAAVKGSGLFEAALADELVGKINFVTDIYGSAEYKKYLVKELCVLLKKEL